MTEQPYQPAEGDDQPAPVQESPAAPGGAGLPARDRHGPETTLWSGRAHWHHFLGRIVAGLLGACLLAWLVSVLSAYFQWSQNIGMLVGVIIIVPVLLGTVGSAMYRILQCRYRLTGQRLFIARGILSQTIDQTELIRVDDVRVHKRLIDRMLGMGTVEIRSTDATDSALRLEGIKNADQVAEIVRNSMRTLRSKSLFIENL